MKTLHGIFIHSWNIKSHSLVFCVVRCKALYGEKWACLNPRQALLFFRVGYP